MNDVWDGIASKVNELQDVNAELVQALLAMLAYGDSEFPANKQLAVDMAHTAIAKANVKKGSKH